MTATLVVTRPGDREIARLPITALTKHGGDPAVWVLNRAGNGLELRPVTVGAYAGDERDGAERGARRASASSPPASTSWMRRRKSASGRSRCDEQHPVTRGNLSAWALSHQDAGAVHDPGVGGLRGFYAYLNLGRAEDPSYTWKAMTIRTPMAGRHRRRGRAAGHRSDREEAGGGALLRLHPQLLEAGRIGRHPAAQGLHAADAGPGPLVPGAQEGGRHPRQPAGGDRRPLLQRRVRRRLLVHLRLHGRATSRPRR